MLLRHLFAGLAVSVVIGGAIVTSPATAMPSLDKVQVEYARHYYGNRHRAYYRHYRRPVRVVRYRPYRYGHYRPAYRYGHYRPARVVRYGYPAYRHAYYRPYYRY